MGLDETAFVEAEAQGEEGGAARYVTPLRNRAERPAEPVVPAAQERMFFDKAPKPIGLIYDKDQIAERAFTYWRERGFPSRNLTLFDCMDAINKLALSRDDALLQTVTAYQVADTFHPHRHESSAVNMRSPIDSFNDDKLLRRAIDLILHYDTPITPTSLLASVSMVAGTQACANFRPGFALAIYRKFATTGANILDTSSGYGGRLVGWIASGLGGSYTGIDPSHQACTSNLTMAEALGFEGRVRQINLPAEDVVATIVPEGQRLPEHGLAANYYDLSFTSPPYFTKERYAKQDDDWEKQSWARYEAPTAWVEGFLLPCMKLQYAALKPGAYAVMNVQDVKIGSKLHSLSTWTISAAEEAGFVRESVDLELKFSHRFGNGPDSAFEPVFVFRKPA